MKLSRVNGFRRTEIERWSEHHLAQGAIVVSDGLESFNAVNNTGCHHEVHVVGGGKKDVEHPSFKWANTVLGNVKNALSGNQNF